MRAAYTSIHGGSPVVQAAKSCATIPTAPMQIKKPVAPKPTKRKIIDKSTNNGQMTSFFAKKVAKTTDRKGVLDMSVNTTG